MDWLNSLGSFFDRNRVMALCFTSLIIWSSLFALIWFKGEALTTNPCTLCAKKIGENIQCTGTNLMPITFYENGSVTQDRRISVTEMLQKGNINKD